ncbi:NCS2 family permease [Breznakia pachnodae]|uniref:AGZA family xanthine/uracil permease-like MFS transporter n=1 Tax=Breznakia pachnodae TaxID=265178 RepID=A0ABU0DYL0_9FIRM|nr:NCS2 family permease [Breznakia pachnodae]MDQ0359666.1 AGZA family xanthine/uracil permease-like MFS transporter [Breznakia pachnodae]
MEKFFKLKENNTTVSTEVLAGVTTFFTMAYILIVNPQILGLAGMPTGAVFIATIIASAIGTLVMGLFANVPYALAPGMGLNAFFTFTVVIANGFSWKEALAMVFICGLINIFITFTNIRKLIIKAIPESLQHAIGGGIGLFIAYIGCLNVGLIQFSDGIPSLASFNDPTLLLTVFGLVFTIVLLVNNVKGAILIGILVTTVVGIPAGVVDISAISFSSYGEMFKEFGSVAGTALSSEGMGSLFSNPEKLTFILITIFAFSLTDTFDTIGTFIGTGRKSGIFSAEDEKELENGKGFSSKMDRALFADSIATSIGALLGTSNTTTYVESSAGIGVGGRTGLTSVVVAICFLLSIVLGPVISVVPSAATAPALIIVGVMMTSSFADIKWQNLEEAIPCFFTVIFMTLAYSISTGIAMGFIVFVVVKIAKKKINELTPILIIATLLFILNYILSALL